MKITKKEIRKILGENATGKQVDIVFALVDFQAESLTEKIEKEIQKLEAKKDEALKKIETDFKAKKEEVFEKTLSKTVNDILKKNGIKIPKTETENEKNVEQEVETEVEENENKFGSIASQFYSR